MKLKTTFLILSIFFLFLACSYFPTQPVVDNEMGQSTCQMRCSRAGMMVDPNNPGCGCVRFPGK